MGVSLCKDTRGDVGTNEEVVARVTDKERLLQILTAIAFSDIRDYLDFGPEGVKAKPLPQIDNIKLYALKTHRVGKTGRSFCIRLHDKGKALAMLLKFTGEKRSM